MSECVVIWYWLCFETKVDFSQSTIKLDFQNRIYLVNSLVKWLSVYLNASILYLMLVMFSFMVSILIQSHMGGNVGQYICAKWHCGGNGWNCVSFLIYLVSLTSCQGRAKTCLICLSKSLLIKLNDKQMSCKCCSHGLLGQGNCETWSTIKIRVSILSI